MRRRVPVLALTVLLPVALAVAPAAAAPRAAASTCASGAEDVRSPQDVNNDGHSDLVLGNPSATVGGVANAGAVEVRFGLDTSRPGTVSTPDVRITAADLGETPAAGDRFGAAAAIADVNGDHCADIVVGAPGAVRGDGELFVVLGAADGHPSGYLLTDGPEVGHLGTTVVAAGRTVWAGAPGREVDTPFLGGQVLAWQFGAGGTVTRTSGIAQSMPKIGGTSETGDDFGSVLAMSDEHTLIVGVPNEDVGTKKDAGVVTIVRTNATLGVTAAKTITQDTAGIGGSVEAGDRFGASVSAYGSGPTVAIGVPGEDLGPVKDAGMAQVVVFGGSPSPRQLLSVTQDTPTVSGAPEAGDAFGSSVLLGGFYVDSYNHVVSVAVGVPGEDLGTVKDAGQVNMVVVSSTRTVAPYPKPGTQVDGPYYRGAPGERNLGGTPHTGDRAGAGLSALAFTDNRDNPDEILVTGGAYLVTAIPGDDTGGTDAGSLSLHRTAVRALPGPTAGERYGVGGAGVPNGPYNNPF